MNDELERTRKKIAWTRYHPGICLGKMRKTVKDGINPPSFELDALIQVRSYANLLGASAFSWYYSVHESHSSRYAVSSVQNRLLKCYVNFLILLATQKTCLPSPRSMCTAALTNVWSCSRIFPYNLPTYHANKCKGLKTRPYFGIQT
jgi:hypothetical protein